MLLSLAFLFLTGLLLGRLFEWIHLPRLIGMLLAGILLGPYVGNLLDSKLLDISTELRQIALILILTRAGLALDFDDLRQVGRPAILMCFVPACFEILGMIVLAPRLLSMTVLEAAILGTVIAAVSPAVIVPRMLHLMEYGYGTKQGIPQMIMAGASVDDVFVIVLFTVCTGLAMGGTVSAVHLFAIPTSITFGLLAGLLAGLSLAVFFHKVPLKNTTKVILLMSVSFLFVTLGDALKGAIGFSGLLAVMAMGATLKHREQNFAKQLAGQFSELWAAAELLLFGLVGASVDLSYAIRAGLPAVFLILGALLFRVFGVQCCLLKTPFNKRERLFSCFAYLPKATVQAAIGSLPLAMGLPCGTLVLTVAVLSILLTAPLGAVLVDTTYQKLLTHET